MKKFVIGVIFLSLLTACGSTKPTLKVDFNPETNFQLFTSYQYSAKTDTSFDANPIMIHRIQSAIDSNLSIKGFTKHDFIDKSSADLTIKVSFTEQEKQSNSSFSIGLGTSNIGGHSRSSIGLSTSVPINGNTKTITKINIDIKDKKQSVWHGSDIYNSREALTFEQKNLAVIETVNRMLVNFPPQAAAAEVSSQ